MPDQICNLHHLRFPHASRCDGGRSEADAACKKLAALFKGNGIAVGGNVCAVKQHLRVVTGHAGFRKIRKHQMCVRSPGHKPQAVLRKPRCQRACIFPHLLLVGFKFGGQRLAKAERLCRDDVHQRAALHTREYSAVDLGAQSLLAENQPAAGPAQRLVRCGRDHIRIGDRAGMLAGGNQASDVRHINHEIRAYLLRNPGNPPKIDQARIGGGAGDNQLGPMLLCKRLQRLIVDGLRFALHAIGDKIVFSSAFAHRAAVRQMAAVCQIHGKNRIANLHERSISRHVRLYAGVGLDIGMLGMKQRFCAPDGEALHLVHKLAAAIISLCRVALRVLVCEMTAHGRHYGRRNKILRRNQLNVIALAAQLLLHVERQLRVDGFQIFMGEHGPLLAFNRRLSYRCFSSISAKAAFGLAPTAFSTISPLTKISIVGMVATP